MGVPGMLKIVVSSKITVSFAPSGSGVVDRSLTLVSSGW